jgi:hypothetical protein
MLRNRQAQGSLRVSLRTNSGQALRQAQGKLRVNILKEEIPAKKTGILSNNILNKIND